MKLPVDSQGRVYSVDGPPLAGAVFNGGLAFAPTGEVYAANANAGDVYVAGLRVSPLGELVETDSTPAQRAGQAYVMGLPVGNSGTPSRPGAMLRQNNQTPSLTDPFVARVRVGPLGGVYMVNTAIPVGNAPVNTVAPDTTGDAKVGSVLTTTQGTWTGTAPITYTYQWYSGINPIAGATTNTYTVQASDLGNAVICAVTATNAFGGATATGPGIRIVSARYNYLTNAGVPASGYVSAGSVSMPNQVRINEIDKDGVNRAGPLSRLRIGDSVFVGTQEGIIELEPIYAGSYFIFDMVSWPALADGPYDVTLGFN